MDKKDEKTISLFKVKVQGLVNKLSNTVHGYRLAFVKGKPKNADRVINDINNALKKFQTSVRKDDFRKALTYLIFIKGQLEVLRNMYGIDTREAQSFVLLLERDWGVFKKMFGRYPKSEWLV